MTNGNDRNGKKRKEMIGSIKILAERSLLPDSRKEISNIEPYMTVMEISGVAQENQLPKKYLKGKHIFLKKDTIIYGTDPLTTRPILTLGETIPEKEFLDAWRIVKECGSRLHCIKKAERRSRTGIEVFRT